MNSVDEVVRMITELELVPQDELRRVRSMRPAGCTEAELLDLLQRQQLLTGYQVERLASRESTGLVIGGCKLLYRNASGSFARLYRGCTLAGNQTIAVKLLRERWSNDTATVQLFRREGELGQRLRHPNIVPIYDVGSERNQHYITMEFVEGGNLRDFLKIRNKLQAVEACRFSLDIAIGLEYALSLGMTHRDLKMTNVLMSSQGTARLIDFGLAADESMLNRADGPDLQQALEYSTLEKGGGGPRNDPRSDLFFLGTILYEMLTGQAPYPRTRDREERKRYSRYRDIRPVVSLEPNLPHSVADITDRLLQVNPDLRYQRAADVAVALRAALASMNAEDRSPVAAPPTNSRAQVSPTILCIESRQKHQDLLRDYFSNRGYRLLILSDPSRAVARVSLQPPDCVLIMGHTVGEKLSTVIEDVMSAGRKSQMGTIVVLGEKQTRESLKMPSTPASTTVQVLQQPVQLRAVRNCVEACLTEAGKTIPASSREE
ncbi:MAG: serine/threonine-protein kinase [Planctomycetaceae bacterium]